MNYNNIYIGEMKQYTNLYVVFHILVGDGDA